MLLHFWAASILVILALVMNLLLASFAYAWVITGFIVVCAFASASHPLFQNEKKYEGWIALGLGMACAVGMMPVESIGLKIMGFLAISVVALASATMILFEKSIMVKGAWYATWILAASGLLMLLPEDNDLAIIPFTFGVVSALIYVFAWRHTLSRLTIGYIGGCIVSTYIFGILALVVFRTDPFGVMAVTPLAAWHGCVGITGICLLAFDEKMAR